MKKVSLILIIWFLIFSSSGYAQDKSESINFNGFLKFESYFDSRKVSATREDNVLLYPLGESLDADGNDLNASPQLTMYSGFSRFNVDFKSKDRLGAEIAAHLDADFMGLNNETIHTFRMRQLYIELGYTKVKLSFGQKFHPFYSLDCFPRTISSNYGIPFQPLSRNPMMRVDYSLAKGSRIFFAAMSQKDYKCTGPNGVSSEYIRNAVLPIIISGFQTESKNYLLGGSIEYKRLKPAENNKFLQPERIIKLDDYFSAFSGVLYGQLKTKPMTFKAGLCYSQSAYEFVMLGGYAVKKVNPDGSVDYIALPVSAAWLDITSNHSKYQPALCAGYSENMGASEKVESIGSLGQLIYARGMNVKNIYRVAPRFSVYTGKTKIALEIEYTAAAYGTTDDHLKVYDEKYVANTRIMFAIFYFFGSK